MAKIRKPNPNCFTCGGKIPHDLNVRSDGVYHEFYCPECGQKIISSIYRKSGDNSVISQYVPFDMIGERLLPVGSWTTWEIWWTENAHLEKINGRIVQGEEDLEKLSGIAAEYLSTNG